jgi:hypothetical protein
MSAIAQMPWTIRILFGLVAVAIVALIVIAVTTPRVYRTGPSWESGAGQPDLHLRVRLDGEDGITVWRVGRNAADTVRVYGARLSAQEREAAVAGLDPVFVEAAEDWPTREPDGASSIRLEVEADPMVPFKYVQWVMLKATNPRVRIYKLSLQGGTADERLDLNLPKDRSCCPGRRVPMRELRLEYFRVSGSVRVTRVRVADDLVEYDDGYMTPAETEPRAPDHRSTERTVDLAPSGETWQSDDSAWRTIEQDLRARWRPGERAVGIVSVPPPTGGDVPYRDVVTGMLLLRGLGVEQVVSEGAITPLREERHR